MFLPRIRVWVETWKEHYPREDAQFHHSPFGESIEWVEQERNQSVEGGKGSPNAEYYCGSFSLGMSFSMRMEGAGIPHMARVIIPERTSNASIPHKARTKVI